MSRVPHTFPLRLTCWRKSEPLGHSDREHFSLSLWSWVCNWGLGFAVFWKEVTVLLNLKHLKYLRPPSLFRIRGIALSSAPVAAHKGSWDHVCSEWVKHCRSHYVIYWTVSLRVCSGEISADTIFEGKLRKSSCLRACWSRQMYRKSIPHTLRWSLWHMSL